MDLFHSISFFFLQPKTLWSGNEGRGEKVVLLGEVLLKFFLGLDLVFFRTLSWVLDGKGGWEGKKVNFFSYPKLGLGKCFPEGPYVIVLFVICLILFGRKMALI